MSRALVLVSVCAFSFTAEAQDSDIRAELAPMAFLADACWSASYTSETTAYHCFESTFDGLFVREQISHMADKITHQSEVLYRWDPSNETIRYHYFDSDGGYREGTVTAEAGRLLYPEMSHTDADGKERVYGSFIENLGEDSYRMVSAELTDRDSPIVNLELEYQKIGADEVAAILAQSP